MASMMSGTISAFPEVRAHYRSARSQALSFLLTVGAKAIVLSSTTHDRMVMFRGLDAELAVREAMDREERVRKLRRILSDKQGLPVSKKARNGTSRLINIRIRPRNGISCLQWRGNNFPYRKKYFSLDSLVHAIILKPHLGDKVSFNGKLMQASSHLWVKIRNLDRELDIGFENMVEADAFVCLIQSQWLSRDFSESQSYRSEETDPSVQMHPTRPM